MIYFLYPHALIWSCRVFRCYCQVSYNVLYFLTSSWFGVNLWIMVGDVEKSISFVFCLECLYPIIAALAAPSAPLVSYNYMLTFKELLKIWQNNIDRWNSRPIKVGCLEIYLIDLGFDSTGNRLDSPKMFLMIDLA